MPETPPMIMTPQAKQHENKKAVIPTRPANGAINTKPTSTLTVPLAEIIDSRCDKPPKPADMKVFKIIQGNISGRLTPSTSAIKTKPANQINKTQSR